MRARRILLIAAIVVVVLLLVAVSTIWVFTNTDWGRERTRRFALGALENSVHGILRVGSVDGNLLTGAILRDVTITDSAGAPFVTAKEIRARYAITGLLRQRIYLNDVTVVQPVVVIDRMPDGPWNYDRIFPRDTTTAGRNSPPDLGSWIRLTNVTVIDGDLTARAPWTLPAKFSVRQRDSAIAFNVGPKGRQNLVKVTGGFQRVSQFHHMYGRFPSLLLADPNTKAQIFDVATLRMTAQPFRPPSLQVTDVRGRFTLLDDSLYFSGVRVGLGQSQLAGDGRYNVANNDLRLRLHADPISTNDLQWIDPTIPKNGTGALDFALDWVGENSDYVARNATLTVAGAKLQGNLGVLVNDTLTFHDTDMRFTRLDTRTIQQLFPTLQSPRQGFLTGRMKVEGSVNRMQLDGDVAFDDPLSGRSRVVMKGGLGLPKIGMTADNLQLTLTPVQVGLGKVAMPSLPIGGTIEGRALLNGSSTQRLTVQSDLVHHDTTGDSRMTGSVVYGPGSDNIPFVNADLQLHPLSLFTVGRFAPAAGLQGEVRGPVKITGPMQDLVLDATLTTPDSGSVTATGRANLASKEKSYDVAVATHLFNARTVSTKAPQTNVTADATLHGTGLTAETVDATFTANFKTSLYDSLTVDSAIVRATASQGMLRIDTLTARLPHTVATLRGTVGLTKTRTGELHYTAAVDSLGALARLLPPPDTLSTKPRPGILAERLERARKDSVRVARVTEVQRAMTGASLPKVAVDTPVTVPAKQLSGAVSTEGVLRGNIYTFDVDGTAGATNVVAYGNSVRTASARYSVRQFLTPQSNVRADVRAGGILAGGFALDSLSGAATYQKPNGTVQLTVHQGTNRQYSADAAFVLNKERNDLTLNNLRLQFDSTVYASARPSLIHFGSAGVDIDSLDVRGNRNDSRVFLTGHVPTKGAADLRFNIVNFEVGHVLSLLESDVPARGLVSLDGSMSGTAANPVFSTAFGASHMVYRGNVMPEVHGVANYAEQTLRTDVAANMEGRSSFLAAKGTVPVNLAFSDVTGSRVPKERAIDVTIDADSMPLDRLPQLSDALADLRGSAVMHARVKGTIDKPDVVGEFALSNAQARIVPAGVTVNAINGHIQLLHDSLTIDSLVARSGGPIRISGGVKLASLANPSVGITVAAANAKVLDNDQGTLRTDAYLTLTGALDSLTVAGSVRLVNGVIYIPEASEKQVISASDPALFSVLDTAVATNKLLFPTESPLMRNLKADVGVTIDRDVFVRSRDANVEVYTDGPLQIAMNPRRRRLTVDGVVLSDRGEYRFQSRRFMIRHGSATFINTPDLNPTLQLTAEYGVQLPGREALTIRILISGTLLNPKIALESDAQPPIAQTDLLSYLAFGRSSSSLLQQEGSGLSTGGSGSGNVVGKAAALAQQQVAGAAVGTVTDQVAGEAARALGADVLNITPADVSPDVGSFLRATQIEFGKYIYTRTFLGLQFRPDPQSLKRPGFQIDRVLNAKRGYSLQASFEPRYLVREPTLSTDQEPQTTSVFGLFLMREWRY